MTVVEVVTHVNAPRARCFDLARSVDAHMHSTSNTSETVIAGRKSGMLALNEDVTWQARHFGVRLSLQSRITAFRRPEYFQDSMVRGPLKSLVHDHYFMDAGNGVTTMRDVFTFSAPVSGMGMLVEALVLRRHFRRFLEARNAALKGIAESQAWRQFVPADDVAP